MTKIKYRRVFLSLIGIIAMLLGFFSPVASPMPANADHTPDPSSVTIAGSLQDELGCPGDWQPDCASTHLTFDIDDDVWQSVFSVPAGDWEYKAALNDSWDESYGANGGSDNIPLALGADTDVKFYYDHKSHWITDNLNSVIATVPGSFQGALGCSGDWQPDCLRSWLQDVDGDGLYNFSTADIPAGDYEAKVTINESWDENYGIGGEPNGPNIPFTVGVNETVYFDYDPISHILTIATTPTPPPGPSSVTIAGSLQSELGCTGDWDPACAATHLAYDFDDDVWQQTFTTPAGNWEYKAALNDSWDENYGANGELNGANIPLSLAGPTDVKFYYDDKSHWVTDNENSVIATIPGSFQSALGCTGDWQPDCLRSWLQDVDGDGIYTFSTAVIPAGEHEAKVTINESWDENYGIGGVQDGPNIPFTVGSNQVVNFSYDHTTHILDISVGGGLEPGDELLVRPVLQHPVQDEVLYFTMPDRFSNGDAANDCGDFSGPCIQNDTEPNVLTHGFLPSDRGYYHGGDIAGLASKLDYLENMGVTAIWVGPIYLNRTVQPDSTGLYGHSAGYHGYWILDFEQVDSHLGANSEFQQLVAEAHSRGIQVFMDIVTNHTADVVQLVGNSGYRNKTDFPYRDVNGDPFDDSDYAYYGQDRLGLPRGQQRQLPLQSDRACRHGERQEPRLVERSAPVSQPRRQQLPRRELPVRRFLRPRRPVDGAQGSCRWHDRYLLLLDHGIWRRRIPYRHHQACQHGILAEVWPRHPGCGGGRRASTTSSLLARSSTRILALHS